MFPYTSALIFYCFNGTTLCVAVAIHICFSTYVSIYCIPDFCLGDTTIEASKDRQIGSITIEKRNRKKRKRIHIGLGLNKKIKVDDDSKEIWNKFLAKRAFDQGFKIEGQGQP